MKTTPLVKSEIVLAMSLAVTAAFAQSNHIPGPQDYDKFSQFITDRNIFDPNRQPHISSGPYVHHNTHRSPPGIQFVGTMSYEKGLFAFFSGNSSEFSKVLQEGGKIADYTVTAISPANVVLESADKKQVSLNVGGGLKQQNGKWVSADAADLPAAAGAPETTGTSANEGSSAEPAAPASASEPNDVLKRLMQQREKENQ
ncbi:MAG: hypothetical protein ABSH48_22235 [Verrucomicrobiota bacterium]|jgi:hypothetical protein